MQYINYFLIRKPSICYSYYCFFDTAEYLADSLFIQKHVRVHFLKEFRHPDYPYRIIFCKVRKCDIELFIEALDRLPNKMALMGGHSDYEEFCENLINRMIQESSES